MAWHPVFQAPGTAGDLFYDQAQDRFVVHANFPNGSTTDERLVTVDRSGAVLGNLTWDGSPLVIDPATGHAFNLWKVSSHPNWNRETWSYDVNTDAWRSTSQVVPHLDGASMVYDSKSDRVVLFGGVGLPTLASSLHTDVYGPALVNETWAYDFQTSTWTPMNPPLAPSDRYTALMVYDSQSDRVILFGGYTYFGESNETWSYDYDNDTWTPMKPAVSPPPSWGASMAYDSLSDRVILFSQPLYGNTNETWSYDYDNNTWTPMKPAASPPFRPDASMAYDSQSDRVVLFGGYTYFGESNETWTYDLHANTWSLRNPPLAPSGRAYASMAYDSKSDRAILFGGYTYFGESNETWSYDYDNDTWTLLDSSVYEAGEPATAYDTKADRVVLFEGGNGETWSYDDDTNAWRFLAGTPEPGGAMAYDAASAKTVLFNGRTYLYDLDTGTWIGMTSRTGPSARDFASLAYDAESGCLILFGGETSEGLSNETWSYDYNNGTWTRRTPQVSPPPRERAGIAYDSQSARVILFGGLVDRNGTWSSGNDTWAYDSQADNWTLMKPSAAPSPRDSVAMAYDSQSDRVVLFGGSAPSGVSNETWSYDYDHDTWVEMLPPTQPQPRTEAAVAYDSESDRLILFGGRTQYSPVGDTWSYDLALDNWTLMHPTTAPWARTSPLMAYDAKSDRIVMYGGKETVDQVRVIDPPTGTTVAGPWPLPFDWGSLTFGKGGLFAVLSSTSAIGVVDWATGNVVRTYDVFPPGLVGNLLADPTGRWLVGIWTNYTAAFIFRLNLTDGTYVWIAEPDGIYPAWVWAGEKGLLTISPDGSTLYVCTWSSWVSPPGTLEVLWLANGSLRSRGSCGGGARNPATGVEALSHGDFAIDANDCGSFRVGAAGPPSWAFAEFSSLTWINDGRALAGIASYNQGFQVGTWDGAPYVSRVLSVVWPRTEHLYIEMLSTSGFNGTSLSVSVDGTPSSVRAFTPVIGWADLNVTQLSDGIHVLRVTGWDLLGQREDETISWGIDRLPPVIRILSALNITTLPYTLYGTANDMRLESLRVNGIPAALDGKNWSAPLNLVIGNNSFTVEATDSFNLQASVSGVVRYWPLHDRVVTNATNRFSIAVPPGWAVSQGTLRGGSPYLMLIEPSNGTTAASFSVTAFVNPYVNDTYACVESLALYQAQIYSSLGLKIGRFGVYRDTVDGHVAASFQATASSWGFAATSVVTVVASAAWHLEYILTMTIPQERASANPETRTWILEGFRIESVPTPPVLGAPEGASWTVLVAAAAGAASAVGVAWLCRRRRRREEPSRQLRRE